MAVGRSVSTGMLAGSKTGAPMSTVIRSARPWTLPACADDVAALVETIGAGPAVVVGYSMGGAVAQLLWRRHPESVAGLVLCATAGRFGVELLPPLVLQTLGLGLSLAMAAVPTGVRQGGMRLLTGRADRSTMAPWALEELGRGDAGAYVQAAAALATFDSTGWIGEVDRPAAVVVTTQDRTVPPARQELLAATIPAAERLSVEADHRACVDAPRLFVPALKDACVHAGAGR